MRLARRGGSDASARTFAGVDAATERFHRTWPMPPRRPHATSCPCDLDAPYDACCGPWHEGAEPPDAPTLMRSRWSAFALGRWDHLWRTLHRDHDDRAGDARFEAWAEGARRAGQGVRYRRLRVLDADGPDADGVARVLFVADVRRGGRDRSFAERSLFLRDGAGWRYLVGETVPRAALPRDLVGYDLAAFDARLRRH